MEIQTKTIFLMGREIRVTERYEGEFESQRVFMEEQKRIMNEKAAIYNTHPMRKFQFQVINAIHSAGGTDLLFLMKKKLYASDIRRSQNRIYVRKSKELMEYLREDEITEIEGKGLGVNAVDPRGKLYKLDLKMWTDRKKYALKKEWRKLADVNGLRKDDFVEIWCFRADSKKLNVVVIAEKAARVIQDANVDMRPESSRSAAKID